MTVAVKQDVPEQVCVPAHDGVGLAGAFFVPPSVGAVSAMLVCHGAGEFKENHYELCHHLMEHGVAALAIDMRGHGESGGERYHVSAAEWARDVRSALDFLSQDVRVDPARLGAFGISSGGTAVLEAAVLDSRLRALVVLDATVRNSLPVVSSLIVRALVMAGAVKKVLTGRQMRLPVLKLFGPLHLVADPAIEAALYTEPRNLEAYQSFPFPGARDSFMVDTIKRVGGIRVPTRVIWGEEDQLDPVETGRLLFEALQCEKDLQVIPGNGHAGHLDRHRDKVFALACDWMLQHLS